MRQIYQIDGVEKLHTIAEVATALRVSYDSARRMFKDLPGVLVRVKPSRYRRIYRVYLIPESVFRREYQRMASYNEKGASRNGR
jgi:hypothetical protein